MSYNLIVIDMHLKTFCETSLWYKSAIIQWIKGAVSRNSAKSGYCKMPVKLKET